MSSSCLKEISKVHPYAPSNEFFPNSHTIGLSSESRVRVTASAVRDFSADPSDLYPEVHGTIKFEAFTTISKELSI